MPQQTVWTIEQIREELKEIKDRGFIPAIRTHDTGVGHTLEQLLGLNENNFSIPDFGKLELKTHRKESGSFITIFTKSPTNLMSNSELLDRYGYPREHDGKIVLHQTISSDKINKKGFQLSLNERGQVFEIKKDGLNVAYYDKNEIKNKFFEKIGDGVILVLVERKKDQENREEFKYSEAYLLKDINFEEFYKLVFYDIRIGRNPNGSVHDHGSAFRIKKQDLPKIFKIYEKIL